MWCPVVLVGIAMPPVFFILGVLLSKENEQEQRYKWERKRRLRWKKSTQYKLKQGYKQDDPEVDLLREPTGKFNYYALAITSEPEKTTASEQVSMSQMLSEGMSRLSLENRQASERKKGRHPPMVERWLLDKYDQDCHKMSAQNFINPSQLITPPGTQIQLQLNKEELPEVAMIALIRGKSTDSEKRHLSSKGTCGYDPYIPPVKSLPSGTSCLVSNNLGKAGSSTKLDWGQFLNQPLRFHWGQMLCHLPCSSCQTHKELGEAGLTTQWCYLSRLDSKLSAILLWHGYAVIRITRCPLTNAQRMMTLTPLYKEESAILAFTADSVKAVESSVDLVDLVSSAYVDSFASSDHRLRSVAHPASTESPSSLAASPSPLNSGKMSFPFPMGASIGTVQRARPKQANYLARPIAVASRAAYYETLANGFSSLSSKATSSFHEHSIGKLGVARKQPDALGTSSANLMKSHETSNSFRAKVLIYCTPARSGSGLAIRRDHHFSQYSFAQLREASRYATYTFLWARSDLERGKDSKLRKAGSNCHHSRAKEGW
ncbi:hypothetical protein Acr_00g0001610 [Actinidia rufa]|uniref:Uncharacterized protein n=1 Tax=Actinidia rufa TaxID=165716 RepID=A0A7J0D6N4_9ERIC|nr:hypothetical protein Acr_00g0001610 [Actinidia rufa]